MLPVAPIGKSDEIQFLQAFQVSSIGLICYASVLHGALITVDHAADDERTAAILSQIDRFSGRVNRVEDDLKVVRNDEADDSGLRGFQRAETDA